VPELDLEIDDEPSAPAAGRGAPPPQHDEVPTIELSGSEPEPAAVPEVACESPPPAAVEALPVGRLEKKRRVIPADQFAEIRRKMQEKMRAAKSGAG